MHYGLALELLQAHKTLHYGAFFVYTPIHSAYDCACSISA